MPVTETTTRTRDVPVLYRCAPCDATTRVVVAITTTTMRGDHLGRFFSRSHDDAGRMIRPRACACGRPMVATAVKGRRTRTECGAKCMASTGPSCECACGGANHGASHAVGV